MTGRKNPKETESEKKHEYRLAQKRGYGDTVSGTEASELDEKGAVGEVQHERDEWQRKREAAREK